MLVAYKECGCYEKVQSFTLKLSLKFISKIMPARPQKTQGHGV